MLTTSPPWRAAEVTSILGLEGRLSYQRLQGLGDLVRSLSPEAAPSRTSDRARAWRLYSAWDVARMCVVVDLCGGAAAFQVHEDGRHPRLRGLQRVREVGMRLRGRPHMLRDPLLEVPWVRQGREVFVVLNGEMIDPRSGQTVAHIGAPMVPRFAKQLSETWDPRTRAQIFHAYTQPSPRFD